MKKVIFSAVFLFGVVVANAKTNTYLPVSPSKEKTNVPKSPMAKSGIVCIPFTTSCGTAHFACCNGCTTSQLVSAIFKYDAVVCVAVEV